jgi:hypothetical protein
MSFYQHNQGFGGSIYESEYLSVGVLSDSSSNNTQQFALNDSSQGSKSNDEEVKEQE